MTNSEILISFFRRVWEQGDLAAVDETFVPDTETKGIVPDMGAGPTEFKIMVGMVLELITPPTVSIPKVMSDGDWVWAFVNVQAEKRDTRTPVHITGMILCRFDSGKVVEAYNTMDLITFFEQLGSLPKNTVALCMTGMELT